MLARERIEYLFDEGTFHELDMLARHRAHDVGLDERPYTDGIITGWGNIDGRKVFVASQDFTVFGGALGEVFAEKTHKVMDLAESVGAPIIGLNDGAGARIQEGRGLTGRLRRHLPPQRARLGRHPADQRDHGAVRRRCRLLARHDRLHLHGARLQPHVHHRSRRGEDGHRRGRDARGARRRRLAQHQVGRGHVRRCR